MLEVSKVPTGPSIQSNVTHFEGVESAYRVPQDRSRQCQKCIGALNTE